MKGLIIKDLLALKSVTKKGFFLLYLGLLAFMVYQFKENAGMGIAGFMVLIAGMPVTTTLELDNNSGWKKTERLLPLSLKKVVGAKYLLLFIILTGASLLLCLVGLILPLVYPSASFGAIPYMLAVLWGVSLLYNALSLPASYHFQSKARIVLMILIILPATFLMSGFQSNSIPRFLTRLFLSPGLLAVSGLLLAFLLLGISYFVSLRLYKKTLED